MLLRGKELHIPVEEAGQQLAQGFPVRGLKARNRAGEASDLARVFGLLRGDIRDGGGRRLGGLGCARFDVQGVEMGKGFFDLMVEVYTMDFDVGLEGTTHRDLGGDGLDVQLVRR